MWHSRRGRAAAERRARRGALRDSVSALLSAMRRVAGMPDYDAHLEHLRRCHPERGVPTRREFYEEFIQARYTDGPTRCC
jgi:uncharacterized short protein YbdD (DUF466 family)